MKSQLKEKKPYYLIIARKVIFWLVTLMLGIAIFLLLTRKDANKGRIIFTMVQLIGMLFVLKIPQFIKNKYDFQIPNLLDFILISFAFSGLILGDVFNFYGKIPYWDSILHTFSGVVIAYVGFIVIEFLDKEYTIPLSVSPLFMSVIVVSVALAIGAVWEIGEYTVDDIFHTNNQQYMQSTRSTLYDEDDIPLQGHDALDDTMKDLMLDLAGAIVVASIEYKKIEHKQKKARLKK
ncbi:hypothetical protein [Candidatus Stoquefichus massiliensis]|uniref:hypothetical protein n=1 Tax=Candidatus Stoquefichus massiliensis TaxID=1470350 RepID=UPI000489C6AA|nr:hypothetical protein [Candidatus Stoquefichus massiliensis]